MSCAYGFQLTAQKVLFVGTAILCYTTVKTDHYKHELQTSILILETTDFTTDTHQML